VGPVETFPYAFFNLRASAEYAGHGGVRWSGSCNSAGRTQEIFSLPKFVLKLYIAGASPRAEAAIANLKRICEADLRDEYTLEIIDVHQDPDAAESDRILATPTLVKTLPPPLRRVIGDLSDREKVLLGLELLPRP
jgi:circadian clock protein KaiB